ncbi:MAG: DUF1211 domain-containing protein [Gammaproteobacteria bacterium]|nr:MAG: DUF1211 domain-containing protein [Gammaproteobacteria bacterium]
MSQGHILKISHLEALVNGIFAIAMTILILDLRLPDGVPSSDLLKMLTSDMLRHLFVYIGSFIILGTLWIAMNFQWGLLERINRYYLWANVFYLMAICVVPFSASLVATYPRNYVSLSFYAINLLCASLGQLIISECAHVFNLNRDIYTPALRVAIVKRILVAPVFYISSLLIAHWSTVASFLLLIAPTIIYLVPGRVDKFD